MVAEAVNTSSIRVSWEAPPTSLTNGIITNYILTYASVATPPDTESVTTMITEELVTMGIAPDTAYTFTVAAKTVAVGPASPTIVQRSYPLPPIPPQDTPHTTHNAGVTTTTIPITLPSVDTSQFRSCDEGGYPLTPLCTVSDTCLFISQSFLGGGCQTD